MTLTMAQRLQQSVSSAPGSDPQNPPYPTKGAPPGMNGPGNVPPGMPHPPGMPLPPFHHLDGHHLAGATNGIAPGMGVGVAEGMDSTPPAAPPNPSHKDMPKDGHVLHVPRFPRAVRDYAKLESYETRFEALRQTQRLLVESLRVKRLALREVQDEMSKEIANLQQVNAMVNAKSDELEPMKAAMENNSSQSKAINGTLSDIGVRSEEELDARLAEMEYQIAHEGVPLAQEKKLIMEMKKLQKMRETVRNLSMKRNDLVLEKAGRDLMKATMNELRSDLRLVIEQRNLLRDRVSRYDTECDEIIALST